MDKNNINFWQKNFENSSFYKKYSKNIFKEEHKFHPDNNSTEDYYEFFIGTFFPCIWFSFDPTYKFEIIQVWNQFNKKPNSPHQEFPLTDEGINDAVNYLFEIVSKKPETDRNNINYWKEKFLSTSFFQENYKDKYNIACDEDDMKTFTIGPSYLRIFFSKKFENNIWVWKTKKNEDRIITEMEEQYFPLTDEGFDEALAYMVKLNQEQ